jgi:1A family penicillin-binding protein
MSPFILKNILKWLYPFVLHLPHLSVTVVRPANRKYHHRKVTHPSFRFNFPRLVIPKRKIGYIAIFIITVAASGALFVYAFVFQDLPSPSSLTSQAIPLTTHIRDRKGRELYKIYDSQNRTLAKLTDLPLQVKQATISIEDKDFYKHKGFSFSGTLRALWRIISQDRLEGGSTITQQLVKTSLLTPERTLRRKIRELVLSISVETQYNKEQILEMYLNRVSYGGSAYGIEEASQAYFGKSAKELDLAQAALLAGLPASPTTYSPWGSHPEMAKQRQKEVLRRMVSDGYITWDQAEAASAQELKFKPPSTDIQAPHFVMYVKELLAQKYGSPAVEQGGLDVTTSLDLDVQKLAQQAVSDETAKIAYLHITNGAALVTNPQTGEILAMVGSRDYFDTQNDGNVNVTLARRQPGSSIKPINYSLALSRGFTPATLIEDSPVTYQIPGQPSYSPVNYDNRYHGRVTLRAALANSYNIPAVKLLSANGVSQMIDLGQKMGITTWTDRSRFGLSLTLGGGEVTMTDMAVVYGTLANLGNRVDLHPILSVTDSRGRPLEEFRCQKSAITLFSIAHAAETPLAAATEITTCPHESVLDPRIAYVITDILSDNIARSPTFGDHSSLYIPNSQIAVKTGTTNDLRDNWTLGYTSNVLVAVWVGNNDNSSMSYVASGVTGASPIWNRIMSQLVKIYPPTGFITPPGLVKTAICTMTGQLACSSCPARTEYFLSGTEPKLACNDDQIKELQADSNDKNRDWNKYRDQLLLGIQTIR